MFRERKILWFTLFDYWFEVDNFINSSPALSILRTNKQLDKKQYSVKICEKTFLTDLSKTETEIFSSFKQKSAKYPIKKAEKIGVEVILALTIETKENFKKFLSDFAKERNIPAFAKDESLEHYDIFNAYSSTKEYLGGIACIFDSNKEIFRYKYGATLYKYSENDLLIWKAMQYAKKNGYHYFDMGGVPVKADSSSQGRYKFKEKFGGELVDFYTYIKVSGPLRILFFLSKIFVYVFFKNDYNNMISFINKYKPIQ
ncbi:MAG: peptidoglycan bridge formation glycyltransferase FemA/FemB family protein [Bacteroidetes bacterium]|jgi:lipid II:glycine glycyltransferase (peptidoglycan interpeptide bridge formation enzyme)|nr:peptidoglycan bridge formation glycyltransferase FemA/FemB family protein [Bacteroidota bacterium]MBT7995286.1 peptidoglycan bridge formation glycyltransferase FemA/FemB family protein [Bacteroidota bacterium]